jgi:hypothetical protein
VDAAPGADNVGILCDPHHPALAAFRAMRTATGVWWHSSTAPERWRMDVLPKGVEPIVRVIDDWFTARSLALMVEVKLGKARPSFAGSASMALPPKIRSAANSSASRDHMHSPSFNPATAVSAAQLAKLMSA